MSSPWVKRLLPVGIITIAVLIGFLLKSMQTHPQKTARIQPRPAVEVTAIRRAPLHLMVSSQGTVTSKHSIEWSSEVAGRVIWVAPELVEGGDVTAATTLLKLDPTDYRVAVANAEAGLADAKLSLAEERNELRRAKNYRAGNTGNTVSGLRQPKLAQVEARVKAAEAALLQARQDLAACDIKAPFSSIIDGKQVDLGQYVSTGTTLFNLLSTDIVEVRLPVTAADIGFIDSRIGQQVTGDKVTGRVELIAALGGVEQRWQGRLVRIERRVDADTRTFFVVAEVEQPYNQSLHGAALTVGMFVDAVIEGLTIDEGVRIPGTALHANRFVYLVENNRLRQQPVKVLRRERNQVVISDGLDSGDQLVLTRLDLMADGMPVSAVPVDNNKDDI